MCTVVNSLAFSGSLGRFELDSTTGSVGWEACVAVIGRSSVGVETVQVTDDSKMTARASHSPEPLVGLFSNS